ncbi:MAG TPA: hypothetical protein VK638_59290 [Edaphobacter sp.]|nr:hypothetical protein [Edaphobacter sp.]
MDSSTSPSNIDVAKTINLLTLQIEKADGLWKLPSDDPQRKQWLSTSQALLVRAFGPLDGLVSSFDRATPAIISLNASTEELRQRRNKRLDNHLAILKSAIEQLEWQLPSDFQHLMPSGSQHDAFQVIRKIIQSAKTDICIVDNYVDDSTWQLLTNLQATVAIRILTMRTKDDFTLEGKHFKSQHGNTVELRKTDKVHDRFIIIDEATVWHLGPSIKDAGSKTAFMSEIHSPSVVAAAIQEMDTLWTVSTIVPI